LLFDYVKIDQAAKDHRKSGGFFVIKEDKFPTIQKTLSFLSGKPCTFKIEQFTSPNTERRLQSQTFTTFTSTQH